MLDMKEIKHFHGKVFFFIVLVFQQVVQGIDVEEGSNGNESASFFEVAPNEKLVVDEGNVFCRGLMLP